MLIALLSAVMASPASATVWTAINDSTLASAISNAQSGDSIFLEEGVYGKIVVNKAVHILGQDAEKVVFDLGGQNIELTASGCTLQGVSVINSSIGVEVKADSCSIIGCVFDGLTHSYGIYINQNNVLFKDNVVRNATGNYFAVYGRGSGGAYTGNTFVSNDCAALCLYINSKNNIITENEFVDNKHAIHLWGSGSGNEIYLNNFRSINADVIVNNNPSAVSWNSPSATYSYNGTDHTGSLGNHWDAYDGVDLNADGVGDTSYTLAGLSLKDSFPLVAEFKNYLPDTANKLPDLVPVSIGPETLVAEQPNRIRVTVQNNGDSDAGHFRVMLKADDEEVGSQIVTSLKSGENTSVAFTLLPSAGNHDLEVIVDCNEDISESDESNNILSGQVPSELADIDYNWFQFHKDVQHTGYYPGNAPDSAELLWVSDYVQAVTSSSPVVAEGKVFINTGKSDPDDPTGGGEASQVIALDQYTGQFAGYYGPGSTYYGSWASPCYYEGNVSCAISNKSVTGGNMIVNGRVYVGDYAGNHYHCSYESNGTEIWSFRVEGIAMGTPAYSDGKVYLTSLTSSGFYSGGYVYCVDARTGEEIWKISTKNDACGTPSIYNDILYVTTYNWWGKGAIYAIDKENGHILWQNPIHRTDSCPAVAYGRVYVSGGCYKYSKIQTYCFDAVTGERLWSTPEEYTGIGGWTNSPVVADGKVFIGKPSATHAYKGTYCLDAFSGEVLWSYNGGGAAPAISDGIVYTIGNDGKVYAFGNSDNANLPVAAFTADVTSGDAPLQVNFTDRSSNAVSWEWDFGNDGIVDSTEQNPSFIFDKAGVYTVSLKVSNTEGNDAEIKVSYITVTEGNSDDWNPWDDPDSDGGTSVTSDELQEAIRYWLHVTPVPKTGAIITSDRLQELVRAWLAN
jgi:parallel beta-helix repeat protein